MTRCLIVDDEPLALDILKRYIESIPELVLIGAYDKPLEAFAALQHEAVDLLFLDIQMPGLTGFELLRSLNAVPKVILTTAYREFALEGFDLEVFDYLVKPISKERFLKSLSKYYRSASLHQTSEPYDEPFMFVKVDREMVKLTFNEVLMIEGLKNYVKIKTGTKDLIVYQTLSFLEEKLPIRSFKRIHKSFIVNLNKIDKFSTGSVVIQGKYVPVGKMYQKELDEVLNKKIL